MNDTQKKRIFGLQNVKSKTVFLFFLSFLIPFVIMMLVYERLGFYPFGEKSILIMDMYDQYVAFFASLRDIVTGESSIFFSWSKAMGGNYIGVFAYYISSPLSFFTLLFPRDMLPTALLFLTALKIALCGLTFSIFVRYTFGDNRFFILIFSICYALMTYNLVFSLCLMWIDGVIWLPIILLGLERILKDKRPALFIVSLTVMFISNYYISYMIGLFCIIYFALRYFTLAQKIIVKDFLGKAGLFAGSSLLAAMLSAWITLPTFFDLMQGKIGGSNYTPDHIFNFDLADLLTKFTINSYDSITNTGLPAIFCGMLINLLVLVFFYLRRISLKETLLSGAVLFFFIISFITLKLDIMWHIFQYPNWFPYRYSFLFSFFMIFIAYRTFSNLSLDWLEKRLSRFKIPWELIKSLGIYLLICLVSFEMYYNSQSMIKGLDKQFGYKNISQYNDFFEKISPLVEKAQNGSNQFSRIEKNFEFSKNDAINLGYNGITHYSSAYNRTLNQFTKSLGLAQYYFWNSYYGATPITDSLFGVKYILSDKPLPSLYNNVDENRDILLYENPLPLSLGFMVSSTAVPFKVDGNEYFQTQNNLLNAFCNTNAEYFKPVSFITENSGNSYTYRFVATSDNPVFLSLPTYDFSWANIYVNGQYVDNYFTQTSKSILFLGEFEKGQEILVECKVTNKPVTLLGEHIYELDISAYTAAIEQLQHGQMDVTSYKNGNVTATVTAKENQVLFTSIPYDKGFSVRVDGKKADLSVFSNTFIMLELSPGTHNIEFTYMSRGFYPGLCISVATLILCIALYIIFYRKRKKFPVTRSAEVFTDSKNIP